MTEPKERPILFSAPMVRALLDGTKTQTRRVVKGAEHVPRDERWERNIHDNGWHPVGDLRFHTMLWRCPYGQPGDRLWVRETWSTATGNGHRTVYRADVGTDRWPATVDAPAKGVWKPSIHMKRAASRITLEVTSVRVERLQEISHSESVAEGVEKVGDQWRDYLPPERESSGLGRLAATPRESFFSLWESINGTESLALNPWVWVVIFRKATP